MLRQASTRGPKKKANTNTKSCTCRKPTHAASLSASPAPRGASARVMPRGFGRVTSVAKTPRLAGSAGGEIPLARLIALVVWHICVNIANTLWRRLWGAQGCAGGRPGPKSPFFSGRCGRKKGGDVGTWHMMLPMVSPGQTLCRRAMRSRFAGQFNGSRYKILEEACFSLSEHVRTSRLVATCWT